LTILHYITVCLWLCFPVATKVTAETSSQCGVIAAASLLPRCQLWCTLSPTGLSLCVWLLNWVGA